MQDWWIVTGITVVYLIVVLAVGAAGPQRAVLDAGRAT
jgi:hypothetical protein